MSIQKFHIIFLANVLSLTYCTIKAPLITFTQTQTAAEKQMLGEDRNLEKDGWLIASIKTSSSGSEIWERDLVKEEFSGPEDNHRYIALRTLAYLAKEVRDYRSIGVLAEGLDGKIRLNPKLAEAGVLKTLKDFGTKSRLEEIIKLVNENRDVVIRENIKKAISKTNQPLSEKEKSGLKESFTRSWIRTVGTGEYFESTPGVWKKKE